jgi:hypothetical protein
MKSYAQVTKEAKKIQLSREKTAMEELNAVLARFQLEPRPDSYLCRQFVHGNSKLTIDEVAQKLCELHYLYNFTEYERIRRCMRANNQGRLSVGAINIEARKYALELAPIPSTWPWMTDVKIQEEEHDCISDEEDDLPTLETLKIDAPAIESSLNDHQDE